MKKIKLRGKLIVFFSMVLVLLAVTICVVIGYGLLTKSERDMADFRRDEMAQVKNMLMNYVDIAYTVVEANYQSAHDPQFLQGRYGPRLKNIVDLADALVREKMALAAKGDLSRDEAQRQALAEIKSLRYDDGTGYIWVNDTGRPIPKMIMHPTLPALNGKLLDDPKYNCAMGKKQNLFQAAVEVSLGKGAGFVDYVWPKPVKDGLTEDRPKLSYVRLIKEWGWVLGTGIYVDDALQEALQASLEDIGRMRYDDGVGYFWINNIDLPIPRMIMHPTSPSLNGQVLDAPKYNCAMGKKQNLFQAAVEVALDQGGGFVDYVWPKPIKEGLTEDQPKLSYVRLFKPLGWVIGTGVYIDEIEAAIAAKRQDIRDKVWGLLTQIVLVLLLAVLASGLVIWLILSKIVIRPLFKVVGLTEDLKRGDLSRRLDDTGHDETAELSRALDLLADNLESRAELAGNIAGGDLTRDVPLNSEKDVLGQALQDMVAGLRQIAGELLLASDQVAAGSREISDSSQSLSQGATEQAASLEEISSSLTEIGSQTRANAESASRASDLARGSRESAESGNETMKQMVAAMSEINASSREIAKIIKAIDDIAFQTNLLALNAAVEAARAGRHGKGFAVVAQEVRSLATRSAKAAQETAELIEGSVKKVETGASILEKTHVSINQIVDSIGQAADLVADIATASNEQAQALSQINQGLAQIDQVTSLNTASAEETAAASEELSSQAAQLKHLVSRFRLKEEGKTERKAAAPRPELEGWASAPARIRTMVRPEDTIPLDG
ncbi:MAG: methyl-accepting chemotaxis protein [Proteobacteria bacterium]|nr:methyl-accepting chemotaxis protein [Pseudomonadota bacterium]